MSINLEIKEKLHKQCLHVAEDRIVSLQNILQETQDAANNETKSSAGDKHETGRAMAQLETEKLTAQLTEALKLKQALSQIKTTSSTNQITIGSVVSTNKLYWFHIIACSSYNILKLWLVLDVLYHRFELDIVQLNSYKHTTSVSLQFWPFTLAAASDKYTLVATVELYKYRLAGFDINAVQEPLLHSTFNFE